MCAANSKDSGKKNKNKTFAQRLMVIHHAAVGMHRVPLFRETVARYGFKEDRIAEGFKLYDEAFRLFSQHQTAAFEYYSTLQTFRESQARADFSYMLFIKIARVALKDSPKLYKKLALEQLRKKAFKPWLEQARVCYELALDNPEILKKLSEFDISANDLETGINHFKEVEIAYIYLEERRSQLREVIQQRNQAFLDMERWWKKLLDTARIALGNDIKFLEALGVKEKIK